VSPGAWACADHRATSAAASSARTAIRAWRECIRLACMVREALRLTRMSDKRELLILGGGRAGMTLARAAAREGIASHVVDRADPAALTAEGFDGRASAISTASWNLFKNIGIAPALEDQACPIASIAVTDGMKPGRIDFTPEANEGSLGRMFANR